ncbi:hypothetical protein MKX03_014536 [Papaver bracteatum]|nr:hypothetical protein MKX03_014536 [Papaver bracteatum]
MDASKKNNKKSIESSGLDPPLNYSDDANENQTTQNPIDDYEPEPSDMSEFEVVKYETKIVSPRNDMPNWIRESRIRQLSSRIHVYANQFDDPLWSPSPEQIRILEMLYDGGLRSPTVQQIEQITSQLIQYGKVELTDVCIWFKTRENQERWEKQLKPPTSPKISKRDEGKAVSIEGKSGTGKGVSMSLKIPDPESQEKRGSDNSMGKIYMIRKIVRDKGKTVSGEEESGIGKEVSISTEISGPVSQEKEGSDNSIIDSKKQREQIPSALENIDVRANIIFLDRDFSEESVPHTPSQQQISLPAVSSSTSSTREEERRWFNLFPWWQKK